MRLVILTAAYPSPTDPWRAVYLENLSRALRDEAAGRPLEITVVAPRVHAADPKEEIREGLRVRRFPYPCGNRRLKEMRSPGPFVLVSYFVSGLAGLFSEIKRSAPHGILAHWVLPCGPMARVAAGAHGIPYILAAHGSDLNHYARASRVFRFLARGSLRGAALVLPVSADLRRIIEEEYSIPAARIRVAPMGVDERFFGPRARASRSDARAGLGIPEGTPTILYVGDLIPEKGVPELIEAQRGLRSSGIPAELILAGAGPLLAGGAADGLPGVRFLGARPPEELAHLYAAADLLVLPSRSEGSPVTIMEALSTGLPVVATGVGGIPDLVQGGALGRLVQPGDARALEAALGDILRSPDALVRLRSRVAESAGDFSCSRRARELLDILDAALKTSAQEAGGVTHGA